MATVNAFDDFVVEVSHPEGSALVRVKGEVDCYTAPVLEQHLLAVIDGGARRIVVHLGEMSFMDSQGLATLVRAQVRLRPLDGQLVLRAPRPSVCKILEISGLTEVLPVG